MPKLTLALLGREGLQQQNNLTAPMTTLADWTIRPWVGADGEAALKSIIENTDAILVTLDAMTSPHVRDVVPLAPKARLLQIPYTGYEWLRHDFIPKGATACNAYGHEDSMAEYVLLGMLESVFRLSAIDRRFKSGSWADRVGGAQARPRSELLGKRLGLVGYGAISQAVARRAHGFGMHIAAVASRARPAPRPLEWLGGPHDLDRLCAESDHIVVATSLTDETRGLIDTRRIGLMKPDAILINVARAPVVDEAALYLALRDRKIGGGVIDVWWTYPSGADSTPTEGGPRPSQFPFHELDNVIMSPHCSANSFGTRERRWAQVGRNLDHLALGEPLDHVIMRRD